MFHGDLRRSGVRNGHVRKAVAAVRWTGSVGSSHRGWGGGCSSLGPFDDDDGCLTSDGALVPDQATAYRYRAGGGGGAEWQPGLLRLTHPPNWALTPATAGVGRCQAVW